MRSTSCKSSSGQFLEEYHSKASAEIGAEEARARYGHTLMPYHCRACGYWHLTAAQTRRQCHLCMDGSLFHKDIYATLSEAQSTIAYLKKEKKVQLYPYRCPHGSGWHLTKKAKA